MDRNNFRFLGFNKHVIMLTNDSLMISSTSCCFPDGPNLQRVPLRVYFKRLLC